MPADLEQCHVFKALSGEAGDEDLDDDDIDPAMIKPRASPASYFLDGTLVFYPDASGHECADWFDRFFALHFENGVKKVQLDEVRGPAPQFRGDDDGEPSIEHFLDYENYPMEYPDEADDERREAEESRFEWDMHVRRSMRGAGPRREIRMLPLPSASGHWLAFKSLDELERLSALASGRSGGV